MRGFAGNKPTVKLPKPAVQTQGIAPITKFAILAERRYILTQDADGLVEMWDATCAAPVRSFGKRVLGSFKGILFGSCL